MTPPFLFQGGAMSSSSSLPPSLGEGTGLAIFFWEPKAVMYDLFVSQLLPLWPSDLMGVGFRSSFWRRWREGWICFFRPLSPLPGSDFNTRRPFFPFAPTKIRGRSPFFVIPRLFPPAIWSWRGVLLSLPTHVRYWIRIAETMRAPFPRTFSEAHATGLPPVRTVVALPDRLFPSLSFGSRSYTFMLFLPPPPSPRAAQRDELFHPFLFFHMRMKRSPLFPSFFPPSAHIDRT